MHRGEILTPRFENPAAAEVARSIGSTGIIGTAIFGGEARRFWLDFGNLPATTVG